MNKPDIADEELRQKLAAIEHERWADWQKWMHEQCKPIANGHKPGEFADLLIPSDLVARWTRQIYTPYSKLSPAEQASDMEQVDRYWPLIEVATAEAYRRGQVDELKTYLTNLPDVDSTEIWLKTRLTILTAELAEENEL